ncbi:MAG TPA: hypothetical protein VFE40_01370 [Jatrophihabitantaceae bacterium]|jgi:hypothetical protein|nr:hypothetical protein [Jatrophihabitantaceae bacterium]
MTGRITMTVEGTPVSDADLARMRAEEELHAEWQRRTVRVVAASASDAADCRMLLTILGLDDDIIAQARAECGSAKRSAAGSKRAAAPKPKSTVTKTKAKTVAAQKAAKASKPRRHAAA